MQTINSRFTSTLLVSSVLLGTITAHAQSSAPGTQSCTPVPQSNCGYMPNARHFGMHNRAPWNAGSVPSRNNWNNNYNNAPWNSSWMPWSNNWNNGYSDNPWNSSWMPWNNNWNNGYSDNPWNSSWKPWSNNWNNGYSDNPWNSSWMPWNNGNDYRNYYPPVAAIPALPAVGVEDRDSDKDGVLIPFDVCPDSSPNMPIDAFGCEANQQIVLRGVNFHTNSDKLTDTSTSILDHVATTLRTYQEIKVEVGGHTDSDGDATYNKDLSQRRATTVVNYLSGKDVPTENMQAMGYGEESPIASNETLVGRANNRRVELKILSQ